MNDLEPIEAPELSNTPEAPAPAKAPRPAKPAAARKSPARPAAVKQHETAWNLFTALLLAATFFVASIYVLIYTRPELLAQNTPLGLIIPTRQTLVTLETPAQVSPTFTPQPSPTPTAQPADPQTDQPNPTATLQAIQATPIDPNATPQGTPEANSFYPFNLQGQINAIDGTIIDQNHGCDWMGVAGRVLDADGSPITGMQIHLVGFIDGRSRNLLTLSGTGQAFGPGGYEFTLASRPIRITDAAWVQLVEQNGLPLSPRIRFSTYGECDKNLIVINFIKVK